MVTFDECEWSIGRTFVIEIRGLLDRRNCTSISLVLMGKSYFCGGNVHIWCHVSNAVTKLINGGRSLLRNTSYLIQSAHGTKVHNVITPMQFWFIY